MSQGVCNNYCSRVSGEYSTNPKIYAATTVLALALILIGVLSLVHINPLAKIPFEASVTVLAGGSLLIVVPCLKSLFHKSSAAKINDLTGNVGNNEPMVFETIPVNLVVRELYKLQEPFDRNGYFYCEAARREPGDYDFSGQAPDDLTKVNLLLLRYPKNIPQLGTAVGMVTIAGNHFQYFFEGSDRLKIETSMDNRHRRNLTQYVLKDGNLVKIG